MAPMEGENAILLQLRETAGLTAELAVSSPRAKIHGIKECDVMGIPLKKRSTRFAPLETKFIKINW